MQIIHNIFEFDPSWQKSVVTLGVFDGMHLGHRALIERTIRRATEIGAAPLLVTYHPHPDLVLGKRNEDHGTEIFTLDEKLALLQEFQLEAAVFLEFTKELSQTTAEDYLKHFLIDRLRAKVIVIGYDQKFGKGREGDYQFLKDRESNYDFVVDQIDPVEFENEIVSSSRIRRMIRGGDVASVQPILGRYFFITGIVVRGFRRGHEIGFPTANLDITRTKILPSTGIYRGWCERGGQFYRAMISIGYNPTFENKTLSVEAHLLDFDDEMYGETIRIHFYDRTRSEEKFETIDALIEELNRDREMTLQIPVIPADVGF